MEIPAALLGSLQEVRTRCRRLWKQYLREGGSPIALFEAGGLHSVPGQPGTIVLQYISPSLVPPTCYWCAVPLRVLDIDMPQALEEAAYAVYPQVLDAFLERPWGLLCQLDNGNLTAWIQQERLDFCRRFLRAALTYWDDVLAVEGQCDLFGYRLWATAAPLIKVLHFLGVSKEVLQGYEHGLPEASLAAFVVRHVDPQLAGEIWAYACVLRDQVPPIPVAQTAPPPEEACESAGLPESSVAMSAAVRHDDSAAVVRLLAAGERWDLFDPETLQSPLSWAVEGGHSEVLALMLDQGADLETRDSESETLLMVAAKRGHAATVRLLLKRGANPNVVTPDGWTVQQFAELGKSPEVLALVKQAIKPSKVARNLHRWM